MGSNMSFSSILTGLLLVFMGLHALASPLDPADSVPDVNPPTAGVVFGNMTLRNKCLYDVWMHWNSIDPKWDGFLHKITSSPEIYNLGDHPFGGNFMLSRMGADGNFSDPTSQAEYNFGYANLLYYDLSNKDSLPGTIPPFMARGLSLTVSGGTGNNAAGKLRCQNIHCPPGQDPCLAAYLPGSTDPQNEKDWSCSPDVDFSFLACSG